MIFFTLPNLHFNFHINQFIAFLAKEKPYLFKIPVTFSYVTGNFPYSCWNGRYNNNIGPFMDYDEINKFLKANALPLRLNCANVCLTERDYEDAISHTALNLCQNGSNAIEISDLTFYQYLKDKYPDYKFVFSNQADLKNEMTAEIINTLLEQNLFQLIQIPEHQSTNLDFLKSIENKKNIELQVNTSGCPITCKNYLQCKLNQHITQYDYSEQDFYSACKDNKLYQNIKPLITIEDIQNIYLPLGITHYSLAEMPLKNANDFLDFFLNYFIKEEYRQEVLIDFLQKQNKRK